MLVVKGDYTAVVLRMRLKTKVPCHRRFSTITISFYLTGVRTLHKPRYCSPLPIIDTSQWESKYSRVVKNNEIK